MKGRLMMETDENGEARLVARDAQPKRAVPPLRILATFEDDPTLRRFAYRLSPNCVYCGKRLDGPDAGGVVPAEEGARLAHRDQCFASAMLELRPELAVRAAIGKLSRDRRAVLAADVAGGIACAS